MRLYNQHHRFHRGIDPHARSMFKHILDDKGKTVFEMNECARSLERYEACGGSSHVATTSSAEHSAPHAKANRGKRIFVHLMGPAESARTHPRSRPGQLQPLVSRPPTALCQKQCIKPPPAGSSKIEGDRSPPKERTWRPTR